jgi:HAE1 family hydrophobic/amphiphilic exporter-1
MIPTAEDPAAHPLLIRATIFRPVGVLMLFLALLVVGVIAYPRIPLQLLPDGLSTGQCGVYIPVPDATPREVMEQVAKPCEDYLRTLPGLRGIVTSSGARRCLVRLELDSRYDMGLLVAELRDRIDRARSSWPEGADRYHVWRHGDSDVPTYIVSLGMDVDETKVDLDYIFDEVIRKRLESIPGVARVNVWGIIDKRIEIMVDKDRVAAHGVNLRQLIERLAADNRSINAGAVRDGDRDVLVRIDGKFGSFEEVESYPAGRFRVSDFAAIGYARSVRDRLARVNGKRSRAIVIHKESGANAVEVCERVEKTIREVAVGLERSIPGAGKIESHAWMNQGEMIKVSVGSLRESGLIGALCAAVVLYLFFRRLGMTLLVLCAIPFSLLITVVWIFFRGGTFNLISLMGLTLGIGMLVDNSIVVVESILRQRELGRSPRLASIHGVRDVALAVSLATLTTVMVFLPIIFLGDPRFRAITAEIGGPLCISVLASLLVALVFIPLGAVYLGRQGGGAEAALGGAPARHSGANRATRALLAWCLRHRLAALLAAGALLATTQLGFRLLPKADAPMDGPRRLQMRLELPKNFTLRQADGAFAQVEEAVRQAGKDLGIRSITCWFDSQGGDLNVFLEPGARIKEQEFFAAIGPQLPRLPGVTYRLGFEDFARDQGGERLRVFIQGNDLDALEEAAGLVQEELEDRRKFPELEQVARWREDEREEVRIQVERRAAQHFGVDTATVSRMVAWALRGAPLADFLVADRELPFWIRYSDADKENVEELNAIRIFRPGGEPLRLENLARYELLPGTGEIHRRNGRMTVGFSARVASGDPFAVRKKVEHQLKRLPLPDGCEISMRQDMGGFEQDMKSAGLAMAMALFLVFFVMGLLFESWVLPFSVLLSVPFAFFGSVWFLYLMGVSLDAVSMIGMLMLVGIVVNNAIVLVDCINRLRSSGERRAAAVLLAVRVRFRPIWMTALTTIFGLLPLMLFRQKGDGVDYKALAVVLVGGLMTSTFFTLFLVPLLYTILDDLRRLGRSLFGSARRPLPGETT